MDSISSKLFSIIAFHVFRLLFIQSLMISLIYDIVNLRLWFPLINFINRWISWIMEISNRINKCVRFHGKIWYQFNFIQMIFINKNRLLFGSLIFGIEWSWKTFRKPAAIKYYSNNCLIKWMLSNGVQHLPYLLNDMNYR